MKDETEREKSEVETEQTAARLKRTKMERRDTRRQLGVTDTQHTRTEEEPMKT